MNERLAISPLRQLARDYAAGRISRVAYVQARRALLDGLEATPVGHPVAPPATPVPASAAPSAAPARPALRRWLPLLGGAAALGLLALGFLLWRGAPTPPPPVAETPAPAEPTALAPPAPRPAPAPQPPAPSAADLVEELLADSRLWEASAREAFLTDWRAKDADARKQAQAAPVFQRLKEEISLMIEAERAAGGDPSMVKGLLGFAQALGVHIEPPPPVAAAEPVAPAEPETPEAPVVAAAPANPAAPVEPGEPIPPVSTAPAEPTPATALPEPPVAPANPPTSAIPATSTGTASTPPTALAVPRPPPAEPLPAAGLALPRPAPPTAAGAGVTARLPAGSGADPCTRAVALRPTVAVSGCEDPMGGSSARFGLDVVPGTTPFAISKALPLRLWCRDSKRCPAEAAPAVQVPALRAWLAQKTGRSYRLASAGELREAAAHGVPLGRTDPDTVFLVRDLSRPTSPAEDKLVNIWWGKFHQP